VEDQIDGLLKGLLGAGGSSSGSQPGIDPQILLGFMDLLSQMEETGDAERLLLALKPYMGPDRVDRIDDAVQVTKLCKAARSAFKIFSERDMHETTL